MMTTNEIQQQEQASEQHVWRVTEGVEYVLLGLLAVMAALVTLARRAGRIPREK
jgi:hypothetical protein